MQVQQQQNNHLQSQEGRYSCPEPKRPNISSVKAELRRKWEGVFAIEQRAFNVQKIEAWRIHDDTIREFMSSLNESLAQIKASSFTNFGLYLSNCVNITDDGIREMALQFGTNFQNIQSFELNFNKCEKITDKGIKFIASQIGANFKKLRSLKLYFAGCKNITNEGVIELAEQITNNIKDLEYLHLDFSMCKKISDIGYIELSDLIGANLQNIKCLRLDFMNCNQITSGGINHMITRIGDNLKNLHQLVLLISDRDQFNEIKLDSVNFIPNLYVK